MDKKQTAVNTYPYSEMPVQATIETEEKAEVIVDPAMLSHIITELMRPVMQTIGKMLENNTAAL